MQIADATFLERIILDSDAVPEPDASTEVYFHFLGYFSALEWIEAHHFVVGASFTYSWMPTMLRLRNTEFERAAKILNQARDVFIDEATFEQLVETVNHSVIGVSKLLHFAAPNSYPIWDSRVARYLDPKMTYETLNRVSTYYGYLSLCQTLAGLPRFERFHRAVNLKTGRAVSAMRAIELVMYTKGSRFTEVSRAS